MARRWVQSGHDVTVITADSSPTPPDNGKVRVSEVEGITVHWFSIPYHQSMSKLDRVRSFTSYLTQASRLSRKLPPFDVVLATSAPLTIAIPGFVASRSHRAPLIFEVRDLWPEIPIALGALPYRPLRWGARLLERLAYWSASHIVALSPGMKAGIIGRGIAEHDISVIPNSSDNAIFNVPAEVGHSFRQSKPWLGDKPFLVYTGAFGVVNNARWLVDLMVQLHRDDPNVQLLLVGFGTQEQEIIEASTRAGLLDKNIHLMSYVSKEEIAAILSAADLSFSTITDIPELANNSANKVFDSFAARTPVAINHGGWLADLLRQSGAGIVLPEADLVTAARLVLDFLADHDALATAAAATADLATGPFSRDAHAAAYEGLLRQTADSGSATAVEFI